MQSSATTGRPADESAPIGGTPAAREFAAQLQESYPLLWTIAAGVTNNRGLAEDVVQEAAIIALGKLNEFPPGANFIAWMAQTVRFVGLNLARREQKRRSIALGAVELPARDTGRTDGMDTLVTASGQISSSQAEFDDALAKALARESDVARACLLLRTIQGLEYSEIAAALQIPEGTAMSHVHRARKRLREALSQPHGDDLRGSA